MLIIFAFEYIQLMHKKTYPKRAGGRQKKDRIIFLERLSNQPVCLIMCILMQSLLNNFNDFHIKKDLWRRQISLKAMGGRLWCPLPLFFVSKIKYLLYKDTLCKNKVKRNEDFC